MAQQGFPALLVSDIVNVQWLSEFTGSYGFALLTTDRATFVTDSRYVVQAREQVKELEIISFDASTTLVKVLHGWMREQGLTEIGFEPSISYSQFEQWTDAFEGVTLRTCGGLLSSLRKIKSPDEVARIQEACRLADACMTQAMRMIQPGIKEFDIGLDIEFFFRRHGAKVGFDPIVVSGPNSALPHGRPSERELAPGDFVTLDIGCTLDGYNSDITRTFVVGKASGRHREIYEQVLRAEVESAAMLVAGSNGREADAHARKVLGEKDLARYFGHSLGHGLGRVTHDPGRLHESADEPIEVGQVWTVEPGVYIEGFGGVRIEDDIHVTADGPVALNHTPKELLELG